MKPVLREYQTEAIASVATAWSTGMKRPAIVAATGLGKTIVLAELCRLMAASSARRPVVLVHRDELVRQSVAKLRAVDPALRVGIIQGPEMGLARTDVVVASVQTLIRRLSQVDPKRFDLLIVDECHHATAASYRKILDHFRAFDENSRTLCLGVTATMSRGDGKGLGEVWDNVVFERGIKFGVENGYLTPAEVRTVRLAELNTDKIRKGIDGDLAAGALGKAMSKAHAGPVVARAYVEFARATDGTLRRGVVFCPTVEVAEAWAIDFWELGVRVAVVTGKTPTEERQKIYADLAAHRIDVLLGVMVMSEGWDCPSVEVVVVGRPTKSMGLLTQIVGRGLRPSPATGKRAALIIDVVGAMGAGLARTIDLSIPEPKEPVAPDEDTVIERMGAMPEVPVEVPRIDWVALDLNGQPIEAAERRKNFNAPEWLRTYGGTHFLPPTLEFPDLIFLRGGEGGPYWVARAGQGVQPLQLADGGDIRDIHPGQKPIPAMIKATDKQVALLRRLIHPHTRQPLLAAGVERPSQQVARELLDVHFASRSLDAGWPAITFEAVAQ